MASEVAALPGDSGLPLGRIAVLGGLALVVVMSWLLVSSLMSGPGSGSVQASRANFEAKTGLRVVLVALTGADGLIDLRYQVIDPDLARIVHESPPQLLDEDSGVLIATLFMGHAHSGDPKAGYTYPMIFVNEHGLVQRGAAVAVVIGDFVLEHVPVQ